MSKVMREILGGSGEGSGAGYGTGGSSGGAGSGKGKGKKEIKGWRRRRPVEEEPNLNQAGFSKVLLSV